MMALGKNTKKHFDFWDPNKDGQIDTDEVHLESKTSVLHPVIQIQMNATCYEYFSRANR